MGLKNNKKQKQCCKHQTRVRQKEHAPCMEEKGGQSGNKDACLKGTGGHSDAAESCERRGPLPELYECEPLSVRVEAVRLIPHKSAGKNLNAVWWKVSEGLRTLQPRGWTLELPALRVRGGTWKWDGGDVMSLKLVPVRLIIQESRLQLDEDLQEKTHHPARSR